MLALNGLRPFGLGPVGTQQRERGTEHRKGQSKGVVVLLRHTSAMDGCWSSASGRFRPPFSNPRAWGGRGEIGDSRRLATLADYSAGKEIDGCSPLCARTEEEEDERGVGGCGAEWLGVVGMVEESQEARGAPLV